MSVVFWKELADHFSSRRFMILLVLIILTGFWAIFTSGQAIRGLADEVPTRFVFLLLLTSQPGGLFSLAVYECVCVSVCVCVYLCLYVSMSVCVCL